MVGGGVHPVEKSAPWLQPWRSWAPPREQTLHGLPPPPTHASHSPNREGSTMRQLLALLVVLALAACAPGTYTFTVLPSGSGESVRDSTPPEAPAPPEIGHPTIPYPTPPEPPVPPEPPTPPTPPEPPAPPEPPVEEPSDPYEGCDIKELPPRSAVEKIIKCPGEPAIVVKRP